MITQVKEFNRQALERYNKAIKDWKLTDPQPNKSFYLFYTIRGGELIERLKGYVVTTRPDSYHFYPNYEEALTAEQSA